MGNNKREIYKTGGGAASILNLSPDEELLLSLIGPSTVGLNDRGGGDRELPPNFESEDSIEILEAEFESIADEPTTRSFRPSDAVDILKRPIQIKLSCNDVENGITKENIETSNTFPTLECYEKPKPRKRKADNLDELIEEYADLKEDRKRLLLEQTRYYKEKNDRETQLINLDLQILKVQKEELEVKLKKLKESC